MRLPLTKTAYLRGRQCPLRLWYWGQGLGEGDPEPASQGPDMLHEAAAVEALAAELFPGGERITAAVGGAADRREALERTRAALADPSARVLLRPHLGDARRLAVVDMLVRDGDGWRVVEVQASAAVKASHVQGLAFQWDVAESQGLDVRGADVVHLRGEAVRGSEALSASELLVAEDITAAVREALPQARASAQQLLDTLALETAPAVRPGPHCKGPSGGKDSLRASPCRHLLGGGACGSRLPAAWAGRLPGLRRGPKLDAVEALASQELADLDLDACDWTPAQRATIIAARTGRRFVEPAGLRRWLNALSFPVAYVDFEFDAGIAIPRFPGMRPYERLPFQWSMHVQSEPGGELVEHTPFLHLTPDDPREAFLQSLLDALPASGSLVAHSVAAEQGVLHQYTQATWFGGRHRQAVRRLSNRWADTLALTRPHYAHPDCRGSWSLKALAPAILGRAYEDLELGDGMAAVRAWRRAVSEGADPALRSALLAYCARDTELLHGIVEAMRAEVANHSSGPQRPDRTTP